MNFSDRWVVGQNLYISMHSNLAKGSNWFDAVQAWIDEHYDYNYGGRSRGVTGHYTQVRISDNISILKLTGFFYSHAKGI